MKKKKVIETIRKVLLVLIIAWMIMVFAFSNQNGEGSSNLSMAITKWIFHSEEIAQRMDPFIRKCAHMAEYALGAILVYSYCLTYEKMDSKKQIIFSLCFTILYAATDELHQLFVSERSGQIIDVLIDSVGAAIGVFTVWFAFRLAKGTEYEYRHPEENTAQKVADSVKRQPLASVTVSVKDLKKKLEKGEKIDD